MPLCWTCWICLWKYMLAMHWHAKNMINVWWCQERQWRKAPTICTCQANYRGHAYARAHTKMYSLHISVYVCVHGIISWQNLSLILAPKFWGEWIWLIQQYCGTWRCHMIYQWGRGLLQRSYSNSIPITETCLYTTVTVKTGYKNNSSTIINKYCLK